MNSQIKMSQCKTRMVILKLWGSPRCFIHSLLNIKNNKPVPELRPEKCLALCPFVQLLSICLFSILPHHLMVPVLVSFLNVIIGSLLICLHIHVYVWMWYAKVCVCTRTCMIFLSEIVWPLLTLCIQSSSIFLNISDLIFFLELNNIPTYVYQVSSICRWAASLVAFPCCSKQSRFPHGCANVSVVGYGAE